MYFGRDFHRFDRFHINIPLLHSLLIVLRAMLSLLSIRVCLLVLNSAKMQLDTARSIDTARYSQRQLDPQIQLDPARYSQFRITGSRMPSSIVKGSIVSIQTKENSKVHKKLYFPKIASLFTSSLSHVTQKSSKKKDLLNNG